ncbi:hypothetical protein FPZ41_30710 [Streptomyces sp. K1PN6]|uniref:Uncharacterized protein n=1 Tax=Streptomyces acidicola TaxID=2596892 RepID=A0A5N8WZB2_9ACTN|nr:hypothetical protein [Streptomyces acidicola]
MSGEVDAADGELRDVPQPSCGAGRRRRPFREGPAVGDGPGAARVAFLCPEHSEGLPEWAGTDAHADQDSMPCGTVLDFRPTEQLLQSHVALGRGPAGEPHHRHDAYNGPSSSTSPSCSRVRGAVPPPLSPIVMFGTIPAGAGMVPTPRRRPPWSCAAPRGRGDGPLKPARFTEPESARSRRRAYTLPIVVPAGEPIVRAN